MKILFIVDRLLAPHIFFEPIIPLFFDELCRLFPGSVIYGPGYDTFQYSSVQEVMEAHGGISSFDAVWCDVHAPVMLGYPFAQQVIDRFNMVNPLRKFPVGLRSLKIPKIYHARDIWHVTPHEWAKILAFYGITHIFSDIIWAPFSKDYYQTFFPKAVLESIPIIPVFEGYPLSLFPDTQMPRKYDVLLAGSSHPRFYPERTRMLAAFEGSELSLLQPDHPGFGYRGDCSRPHATHPYLNALTSCRISAFCSTRFNFTVSKFFEGVGAKTVPLCNFIHGLEILGFQDGVHFIMADGNNCVERARAYLNEPDRLLELAERGHAKFVSDYTLDKQARLTAEMLPALLNEGKALHWAEHSVNLDAWAHKRKQDAHQRLLPSRTTHILDYELPIHRNTWELWFKLGSLNFLPKEDLEVALPPESWPSRYVAMAHFDILKAEFLAFLSQEIRLFDFIEINAGTGFYSMAWAEYLSRLGQYGEVRMVGDVSHAEKFPFVTPYLLHRTLSRKELWGDTGSLVQTIVVKDKPSIRSLDFSQKSAIVFFNKSTSLVDDFSAVHSQVGEQSLFVFNDYSLFAPEVLQCVHAVAEQYNMHIHCIDCEPNKTGLAVLGRQDYELHPKREQREHISQP